MRITCISMSVVPAFLAAVHALKKEFKLDLDARHYHLHQIDHGDIDENDIITRLRSSDCVLLDLRGRGKSGRLLIEGLQDFTGSCLELKGPTGPQFEHARLGSFTGINLLKNSTKNHKKEMQKSHAFTDYIHSDKINECSVDIENYRKCMEYWNQGGVENVTQLLQLLLKNYHGYHSLPDVNPPICHPDYGVFHPKFGYFSTCDEYLNAIQYKENCPTIGVIFHGGMHIDQNIPSIKAICNSLSEYQLIPVYSNPEDTLKVISNYFIRNGEPIVDAIINLKWFRLNGGPMGGNPELTQKILQTINVPVFSPVSLFAQHISEWLDSISGISPHTAIMSVIWPELDGCIEPIPICGLNTDYQDGDEIRDIQVMSDRISRISSRIKKWIQLKNKLNSGKKIALIIYSYPPGEGNIGGASYLNTFVSVNKILQTLKDEGYEVTVPDKPLHQIFEERNLVNSSDWKGIEETAKHSFLWETTAYNQRFNQFSKEIRDDVTQYWDKNPGSIMVSNDAFILPGVQLGNIWVGVQPARPSLTSDDVAKAAHDKTKPPHHQYIAFYRWLEEVWQADAIIHVGTHGLAEFTKGKEIGLSENCFPDILIGNIPHLYYYTVTNTAEATIAKRRLYGTLLSYNSPPFTTSGLYESYLELEDLIEEHEEAERLNQTVREERTRQKIITLAEHLHLEITSIHKIHEQLYEIKRAIIPAGLHIIGEIYPTDVQKNFIECFLRYDRDQIFSLNRLIAESKGYNYDELIRSRQSNIETLKGIDKQCSSLINTFIDCGIEEAIQVSHVLPNQIQELTNTLQYGLSTSQLYLDNSQELKNCIRGINMEFISPKTGGDIIRNPYVLPTGGNLLQFDPTKIPTTSAGERGKEIAENTILEFFSKDGIYPEKVGVVLWGFETSSSGGETIGQIFGYLGVTLTKKPGDWASHIEVIPLETLGRPRIDCHISICGFFRDMFPNIIQLINDAFSMVSLLDESVECNYVKKHTSDNRKILQNQVKEGYLTSTDADQLSTARIFGPRSGEYGTRILGLTEDSVWKEEKDLVDVYLESSCHAYIGNFHGIEQKNLYLNNLKEVALVSQIRDRHDREVTDLDHYFEYFGGLSRAVEEISGKSPLMLITDTTQEIIKTEGISDAINRGVRTRLLNPKWIDEMLKHDYHGCQQIADRVYVMLGFASTTHSVENWVWSSIAEKFVFNEEMRNRLLENNQYATLGLVKRLLEAEQRGYWRSTEDEKNQIRDCYLNIEGYLEENV